jgi:hypothetical protein
MAWTPNRLDRFLESCEAVLRVLVYAGLAIVFVLLLYLVARGALGLAVWVAHRFPWSL